LFCSRDGRGAKEQESDGWSSHHLLPISPFSSFPSLRAFVFTLQVSEVHLSTKVPSSSPRELVQGGGVVPFSLLPKFTKPRPSSNRSTINTTPHTLHLSSIHIHTHALLCGSRSFVHATLLHARSCFLACHLCYVYPKSSCQGANVPPSRAPLSPASDPSARQLANLRQLLSPIILPCTREASTCPRRVAESNTKHGRTKEDVRDQSTQHSLFPHKPGFFLVHQARVEHPTRSPPQRHQARWSS
jgi:hypothetical protein